MPQSIPGNMRANARAAERTVVAQLQIGWGMSTWPTDWDAQTVDETSRLLSFSTNRRLELRFGLAAPSPLAEATITLDNRDQRFSPFNTSSPLAGSLMQTTTTEGGQSVDYPRLFHIPIRLRIGFSNPASTYAFSPSDRWTYDGTDHVIAEDASSDMLTIFSGYIEGDTSEMYSSQGDRLVLRCLDRGALLLQRKESTLLYTNQRSDQWITYLAQLAGINDLDIDTGFFVIPYAWLDDEPVWNEIQAVANAEGGFAFFDENGTLVFRNVAWWADPPDGGWAFHVKRFVDLQPTYEWQNVGTSAIVEYQPRYVMGEQVVYRSDDTLVIPAGDGSSPGTATVVARLSYPCLDIYPLMKPGDWLPVNSGGTDLSDQVQAIVTVQGAQRLKLDFSNYSGQSAFVPSIQVRGLAVVGGPSKEHQEDVSGPLVPTKISRISGNAYIQRGGQAQLLSAIAADRARYPRLSYRLGARAVPWLQLGDKIVVRATDVFTLEREVIITSIDFNWSPLDPFMMQLECLDRAGLAEYAQYFVIGTSYYGAEGVAPFTPDSPPVFY